MFLEVSYSSAVQLDLLLSVQMHLIFVVLVLSYVH